MNVCVGIPTVTSLHEAVDESIVLLTAYTRTLKAQVHLVIKQFVIIHADIENDGQCARRVYTGARGVDDEFGDTDQDAANPLVANAQNLLAVAIDNDIDIFRWALSVERVFDVIGLSYV